MIAGVTDPDEIDRLLEAEDARRAERDDGAVMAAVPRCPNPDAVTEPIKVAEIRARIAYDHLPWWRRWPFRKRPVGYVNRNPIYY